MHKKLLEIQKKLKSMSKTQFWLLVYAVAFVFCAFPMAKVAALLNGELMTASYWRGLFLVFTTLPGLGCTAVLAAIVTIVCAILSKKNKDLNGTFEVDERGVAFSEDGSYGTARWMSKETAQQVYEVCRVEDCNGTILGQFTEDGEEVIALPYKPTGNRNLILIGPPGTGKSFGYVRTAVFQSIKRGESVVVTDPKGEIHNDMRKLLEANGYVVWVFNLINLQRSDAWDCAREIYNPVSGDIDEQRVIVFCETIMKNTAQGDEDEFWGPGEKNLFKVAVMYCAFVREQSLIKLYSRYSRELMSALPYMDEQDKAELARILEEPDTEMNVRREICRYLAERVLDDEEEAERMVREYEKQAPTCTISDIYFSLLHNDLTSWENKFRIVPLSHPAASAWAIFKGAGDKVQPGFITGLSQRLQLFQMRDIRRITCNDEIHLEEVGSRKTALFLVISDDNASMQMLSSLMFSFLFKDNKEAYDLVNGKGRISINVIADEAANTGAWPSFEKTISTARSRQIAVSIILQSLPQLSTLYGPEIAETIIGCCNTILILGCNDEYTAKYVEGLSGIATVRSKSVRDTRTTSTGYRHAMQGYSLSEGDGKRALMNADEVRSLKEEEILIFTNGQRLLKAKRFGFIHHPYASDPAFIQTSWSELPSTKEKYKDSENRDAFSVGDLQNLHQTNTEIVANRAVESKAPEKAAGAESKNGAGRSNKFKSKST